MHFMLPFQVFQFILVNSLVQVVLLSTIRMCTINGTVITTLALTGVVALAGAWVPLIDVPGAGISGLAAPARALP